MSKTTAISIIIGALLLLGGALAWWYVGLSKNDSPKKTNTANSQPNFFPFGNSGAPSTNGAGGGETATTTEEGNGNPAPQIRQVYAKPISGFVAVSPKNEDSFVRYMDRESGNIYDAALPTITNRRITNTTISGVRNLIWFPDGKSFLAQYLGDNDQVITFYGGVLLATSTTGEGTLTGKFIPSGITDLSIVSPKDSTSRAVGRIFYLTRTGDSSQGYLSNANGEKSTSALSSKTHEWIPFTVNEQSVLLLTKPSGLAAGFLFNTTLRAGSMQKILGPFLGLMVLPSKAGTKILFSEVSKGEPQLFLYDGKTKKTSPVGLSTFADKCAWTANETSIYCGVPDTFEIALYPDNWYQGKTGFIDSLWKIDTASLETKEVVNLPENNALIDVDQISIDERGEYVLLRNKYDDSLWSIKVAN